MNLFPRAFVPASALLLLSACHYPHPPIPPSIPVPPGVFLSLGGASAIVEGVRVEGRVAEDGRGLTVQIYNESGAAVELLFDEWALTAGAETSPVFVGTAIRPKIGKRPVGTVRLAPGELHLAWVGMASRHKEHHPFEGTARIELSFAFMKGGARNTGTLEIPLTTEEPI
jgi:hypothetical protein